MKRFVACIVACALAVGLIPAAAFAEMSAVALDAAQASYDVSDGRYGPYDTVRRMYTRPISLTPSKDGDVRFRTTAIDLQNEIYDGADFAVRYTGAKPYLAFSDASWKGWTRVAETRVEEDPSTGEKVAFFSRANIQEKWDTVGGGSPDRIVNGARTGVSYRCQWMFACVDGNAAEDCRLVEVVALGGDHERVDPKGGSYHEVTGLASDEIAREMRAGYNMAGHFDANWVPPEPARDGGWGASDLKLEANWARGTYITRATIQNLKREGFNAVRLPVTWFQHIYPEGDPTCAQPLPDDPLKRYHIDRAWLERVHEVVDWCIAEDMFVIVNIHHEDWIDRPDLGTAYDETDLPQKFAAVWTQIADEFAGYDQHLVFEDMNEPHAWFYKTDDAGNYILDANGNKTKDWGFSTAETVDAVNRLNADFVALMRGMPAETGHAERLLMLAHDTGNGDISYTGWTMPAGDGPLAASIHAYSPHEYTHYFADGKHAGETGEANVYTEEYRRGVEATWDRIRSRYAAKGITVVLGEFGCYYYGDSEERQQDRLDWMTQYATHAKELGIPLFYWRMDRTEKNADGSERVVWSAFDEQRQKISDLSAAMFGKWFDILDDEAIGWGSNAEVLEGEHADISDGVQLSGTELPVEIHYTPDSKDTSWRVYFNVSWDQLRGGEIAVKYTGNTPRLALVGSKARDASGSGYKGFWWGFTPDTVDEVRGIAYFKAESVKGMWEEKCPAYDFSLFDRIAVRTPNSGYSPPTPEDEKMSTTIEAVAIIPVAWRQVSAPTCVEFGREVCECGERTLSRIVPALGHDWEGGYTVDAEPTRTAAGSKSIHCSRCDARKDVTELPMLAKLEMSGATIELASKSATFNGRAQAPKVTAVKHGGTKLDAKDYQLSYWRGAKQTGDFTSAGKITVKATARDGCDYAGSQTATYTIARKKVTPVVALSKTSLAYTGKQLKPGVSVWLDGKKKAKLAPGAYSVTWKNNVNPGKATATVSLAGDYSGSKSVTFTVNPKGTALAKLAPAKKGLTATWKKQAAKSSGYQLQLSTKKNFKAGLKTYSVANAKSTSKKVSGLKAKTKYWIRIRTFAKVSGKAYYSAWSAAKAVTTKK